MKFVSKNFKENKKKNLEEKKTFYAFKRCKCLLPFFDFLSFRFKMSQQKKKRTKKYFITLVYFICNKQEEICKYKWEKNDDK